jgi:hypothetical protein
MSKEILYALLILESVEEGLNYLLESSNIILCTFFVKLLRGEVD